MKKAVFLASIVVLMVFSVVTGAFASTVYFDYTLGGNQKFDQNGVSADQDRDNYLLGVEVPFDRFKVVLEGQKDTIKDTGGDTDITTYTFKGGYGLVQNEAFQLYGNLAYTYFSMDGAKYSPIMIGIDGKYTINERMFISGNVDYAVSGKFNVDPVGDLDTNYMAARVKYTFLFTPQLGASVGYNWSNITMKQSDLGVDNKMTETGYIVGLSYNF